MGVKVFLLEDTGRVRAGLRRYAKMTGSHGWTCDTGWHQAITYLGSFPGVVDDDGFLQGADLVWPDHADPRWPVECDKGCGYVFDDLDVWQEWSERLYRRPDTGEEMTLRDAPPGAMWDAWWYPWKGPDGLSLTVKCPNGREWLIDGRASNCTLPADDVHRCWVRHGVPPAITVDKAGVTCQAGAGSIQAGDYHGFLRDGQFDP